MAKIAFIDGDPSQGILGTVVTAGFLNALGPGPLVTTALRTMVTSGNVDKDTDYRIIMDCSGGDVSAQLPALTDVQTNRMYWFKRKSDSTTNTGTVLPSGSETIDGESSLVLTLNNERVAIIATDDGWETI
jgi:hypothetical protein